MHRPSSTHVRTRIALAAAVASGLFLAACGGGGDSSSQQPLTQAQATADAANGAEMGSGSASSVDTIFDTTQTIATASVTAAAASRAHAEGATGIVDVVVNCAGGGTATITISGGTLETQLNGRFDAGEHYSLSFAQCSGRLGLAQVNGGVEMDIVNVATTATGSTTSATLNLSNLSVAFPGGSVTYNGAENLSRVVVNGDNLATTTTSTLTSDHIGIAATYNSRSANFVLSNVDVARTVDAVAGIPTGSSISGHHTLNGSANGQDYSYTVSTNGGVSYDATGTPVSGSWTTLRPDATIVTTVADAMVTITVDEGNNGSIDSTWTFPIAQLVAAAD